MKNLLLCYLTIFVLSSCSSGVNLKTNKFLGQFPSLEKKYDAQITKKEKERDDFENELMNKLKGLSANEMEAAAKEMTNKATQMDEMEQEIKALMQEKKETIEQYLKESSIIGTKVPFDPINNEKYVIKEVSVKDAGAGYLHFNFSIIALSDIESKYTGDIGKNYLFIYFKALNSEGKEIPGSKTVTSYSYRKSLKEGTAFDIYGTYQRKGIVEMEDFAKIVEISKEEYESKI